MYNGLAYMKESVKTANKIMFIVLLCFNLSILISCDIAFSKSLLNNLKIFILNEIYLFNIMKILKKYFSENIAKKVLNKNNTANAKQYLMIKCNEAESYMNISRIISENFKVDDSSQIYKNEKFFGYLELDSNIQQNVLKSELNGIFDKCGYERSSNSFEIVSDSKDIHNLKSPNTKRFSLLNNNLISTIVSVKLYNYLDGDFNTIGFGINSDIGFILDKLEEKAKFYDLIQIQAEPDSLVEVDYINQYFVLKDFLSRIRKRSGLKDKVIIAKSKSKEALSRISQEGVDVLNISSGGIDPSVYELAADNHLPIIISGYSNIDNLANFDKNIAKNPSDYLIKTLNDKIKVAKLKGNFEWNLTFDLELEKYGVKSILSNIYENLPKIKQKIPVSLISSNNYDLNHLVSSGINLVRCNIKTDLEKLNTKIQIISNKSENLALNKSNESNIKIQSQIEEESKIKEEIHEKKLDSLSTLLEKLQLGKI